MASVREAAGHVTSAAGVRGEGVVSGEEQRGSSREDDNECAA